jgi:hypothetical protein
VCPETSFVDSTSKTLFSFFTFISFIFKDCDDCLDKEILRLRSLIEEQENIIDDTRIELRKLSKGLQY